MFLNHGVDFPVSSEAFAPSLSPSCGTFPSSHTRALLLHSSDSMHVDMISSLISAVYPSIQPFPSFFLSIRSFCFSGKWSKVLHVLMAHFHWLMAHGFSELHHDGIKTEQMCVCVCKRACPCSPKKVLILLRECLEICLQRVRNEVGVQESNHLLTRDVHLWKARDAGN